MQRLHSAAWISGAIAVFSLLGAAYAYDVLGRRGLTGILLIVAVAAGRLSWQITKALRRRPKT